MMIRKAMDALTVGQKGLWRQSPKQISRGSTAIEPMNPPLSLLGFLAQLKENPMALLTLEAQPPPSASSSCARAPPGVAFGYVAFAGSTTRTYCVSRDTWKDVMTAATTLEQSNAIVLLLQVRTSKLFAGIGILHSTVQLPV